MLIYSWDGLYQRWPIILILILISACILPTIHVKDLSSDCVADDWFHRGSIIINPLTRGPFAPVLVTPTYRNI